MVSCLLACVQVQKIRLLLRERGLGAVRVGTVDDYQGQEERIILISTACPQADVLCLAMAERCPRAQQQDEDNSRLCGALCRVFGHTQPCCRLEVLQHMPSDTQMQSLPRLELHPKNKATGIAVVPLC